MMARLRDETGETVIAGKRFNDAVIYLAVAEGTHTIRYSTAAGDIKPLHSSAIGKALLSISDDLSIDQLNLDRYTKHTICEQSRLEADIKKGKRKGYFTTRGENVEDVMALASVVDLGGDHAAIAIAGPVDRIRQNEATISAALIAATSELDEAI